MAMTLRLTEEQDRRLTELAGTRGVSKHELVVRALSDYVDRAVDAGDIRDWADHALVRYADLLERLAQ